MSQFLDPLRVMEIPGDERHWRLLEPCEYYIGTEDSFERVVAPTGFVTDFGSIPRILWSLPNLNPYGKFRRAYVIHDYLYQYGVKQVREPGTPEDWGEVAVTRGEADAILREAIGVLGGGRWTRFKIWSGVRLGGWEAWRAARATD